jgi:hypothetical protein
LANIARNVLPLGWVTVAEEQVQASEKEQVISTFLLENKLLQGAPLDRT